MVFKNSRQTYALHLMNSLLNIFCYIISNVSIRKNLHMVQLMTESYPDKQNHFRSNVCYVYKGHGTFFPNNLGQSSRDSENLSRMPKTIRGMHPSRSEAISQSTWGIVLGL